MNRGAEFQQQQAVQQQCSWELELAHSTELGAAYVLCLLHLKKGGLQVNISHGRMVSGNFCVAYNMFVMPLEARNVLLQFVRG